MVSTDDSYIKTEMERMFLRGMLYSPSDYEHAKYSLQLIPSDAASRYNCVLFQS